MQRSAVCHRLPARTTRRPLGSAARDAALCDWLLHADSLTARIRASSTRFEVQVICQGVARATVLERRSGLRAGRVHRREVLLLADGVPVVWARTVLLRRSLAGPWHFLRGLGTRPLGARLFTDPRIRRDRFIFHARCGLAGTGWPARCWPDRALAGRSARLERAGHPAVLTEVLLPGVLRLQAAQSV